MKKYLLPIVAIIVIAASCNPQKETKPTTETPDTPQEVTSEAPEAPENPEVLTLGGLDPTDVTLCCFGCDEPNPEVKVDIDWNFTQGATIIDAHYVGNTSMGPDNITNVVVIVAPESGATTNQTYSMRIPFTAIKTDPMGNITPDAHLQIVVINQAEASAAPGRKSTTLVVADNCPTGLPRPQSK